MPPMMPMPPRPGQGAPIGATPAPKPPMQPPQGGPPGQGAPPGGPGGGGGAPGGKLNPQAIQKLAQAMTPDVFQTFMQVFGAVMMDAYSLIQKSAQGGGQPQPGQGGPPGQPPQRGMMPQPQPGAGGPPGQPPGPPGMGGPGGM